MRERKKEGEERTREVLEFSLEKRRKSQEKRNRQVPETTSTQFRVSVGLP